MVGRTTAKRRTRGLPGSAWVGLVLALCATPFAATAQPDASSLGPAPRDENGRFRNSIGDIGHGSLAVRLPFFLRRIAGTFRDRPGVPDLLANDGEFLRENAMHSEPTVTWIGHATLLVQMDHVTFLTDPIWSDTASPVSFAGPRRFVPPGLALEALPPIDFVVVSHNHYDHLDLATLRALAARNGETRFFVPLGNGALLREKGIEHVVEFDWGESREHRGVRVTCLPTQHWSKRGLGDDNEALWASWAVVGPERRFYFAGDTGWFDGFARIGEVFGSFDLAAVPIGAYEPAAMMRASHLDPEEAVRAALDLRARRALAIHYGTFDLSDEPLDEPPRRFRAAAESRGLTSDEAWVLLIGETRGF
jgi:N-acyl-phosphatidylethanolamine-hydrolysing phospholipase D